MFSLTGQVIGKSSRKIKSGDNAGKQYQVLQLMFGSDSRKKIEDVADFRNKITSEIGEVISIPVFLRPQAGQNGRVYLNLSVAEN